MGKIILSLVALATAAGLASAADLPAKAPMYQPPAPAYNWTGFYFFGGAGGGVKAGWRCTVGAGSLAPTNTSG